MGYGFSVCFVGQAGSVCFSSHAVPFDFDAMSIVDDSVENGDGDGGFADHLMPCRDRQLSGDDGGSALVPLFEELEQIEPLLIGEGMGSPPRSRCFLMVLRSSPVCRAIALMLSPSRFKSWIKIISFSLINGLPLPWMMQDQFAPCLSQGACPLGQAHHLSNWGIFITALLGKIAPALTRTTAVGPRLP